MSPMGDTRYTPAQRAALALAVAAQETSDYARGIVRDLATPMPAVERIRNTRRLGALRLQVHDLTVLLTLLQGAPWGEVADALGLPEEYVRETYQPQVDAWIAELPAGAVDATIYGDYTTGLRQDTDPEGTAATVDAWLARHSEWFEVDETGPVGRALLG